MKVLSLLLLISTMTMAMQVDACNSGFHLNEIDQGYITVGETTVIETEATAPVLMDYDCRFIRPTSTEAMCSSEQTKPRTYTSKGLVTSSEGGMVLKKPNNNRQGNPIWNKDDRCRWLRQHQQV